MDKQQAVDLVRKYTPAGQADLLANLLLPSARIEVHDGPGKDMDGSGGSHFGGLPSLPPDAAWPVWDKGDYLRGQIARLEEKYRANPRATGLRDIAARMRQELSAVPLPLPFLAQVSLGELHAAVPLQGWPREGTLVFFCETSAWGFDPLASGHARVLFFPADEELAPAPAPSDLPDDARFPLRRVRFRREWTLPTRVTLRGVDLSVWGSAGYRQLCAELMPRSDDEPMHRCAGHPQEIQGDMRLECQLVTHGIYCGDQSGYEDPRRSVLESGTPDWHLLLQIDSDEKHLGWMWGDDGRVYFWSRRQDIEAGHFGGAWAILQCY